MIKEQQAQQQAQQQQQQAETAASVNEKTAKAESLRAEAQ